MRGKWLLLVCRFHLYLSVFFAPLLLLFIITGWAQTMDFDHSTALMQKLSNVHTKQYFSLSKFDTLTKGKPGAREVTLPFKFLIVAMCLSLMTSISLGLVLAFMMVRNRIPVLIALILGIATPVLLLALAHVK